MTSPDAGKTSVDPVLAMSLLVRDEVGLIRSNIEFHRRMGVDGFVVTDNGSVDGTREALEELQTQHPILVIDEPSHTMRQDEWVTRMARLAETHWGADWIINGDADEFWHPASGSLKAEIDQAAGVLSCRRSNMLVDRATLNAPGYAFYRNVLRVVRPYGDPVEFQRGPARLSERPVLLFGVRDKVMCRLRDLQKVGYGNHDAVHRGPVAASTGIQIYHYPVRTFAEFRSKVVNHGTSLRNNPALPHHIGWHVRRWYALHEQGLLEQEYDRLVLDDARRRAYLAAGAIGPDFTMWRCLAPGSVPDAAG